MATRGVLHGQQGASFPPPRGMVNDFANVIPADQAARIERLLTFVRGASKGEITLVTLPEIGTRDVGDVALAIGRQWKVGANTAIGDAARNAGTVILLVPKETSADGRGHITITTGQGTEGFITDGQAGDIRREATPLLAARRYGDGLELIATRVAERYAANFRFALDSFASIPAPRPERSPSAERGGRRSVVGPALIVFMMLLLLLSRGARGGMGRSGCLWFLLGQALGGGGRRGGGGGFGGFGGGGGGGGGFGGFGGGGGFSGGGSSGSF